MSDPSDVVLPIPNLSLAQSLFTLSNPSLARFHNDARAALLEGIKADEMGPWYRSLTQAPSTSAPEAQTPTQTASQSSTSASAATPTPTVIPFDATILEELEKKNSAALEKLNERLKHAQETEGESEISDALRGRANYLTKIGDKGASAAQLLAFEKTPGLGSRIDIALTLVRIAFFWGDREDITKYLSKAEVLIEEGGDWDRRNRLKVYRGLYMLSIRQFKSGGDLFIDALSTFTTTELISYNDFVGMTVIAGVLGLSRVELKKKIISSPEVNQVLPEIPLLGELVNNLYACHYDKFFVALAELEQTHLLPSRILAPHTRFYVREMRIHAYSQLLESYRSLTLDSLSGAFGVSVEFIDNEISRFIAAGRLHCSIDKVHGTVETTRPLKKNAQYETVVKQGDVLLGEVQRLCKVLY
ncbi:26S proteasome subunit RPN7-domain-containing protein [Mycena maculata]|uniref:26S proteasome subunit RPN7-domain-containing protein n=1 Tax=Mycena maculata TaxID=230809 RepID=A0AAD7J8G9_9AGAR|nr:26S proteasome subunit RPN7-domain-containing protein [Mycena maculata]